jgi:hypothetical protein
MLLNQKMPVEANKASNSCDGAMASANMRTELPKQPRILCPTYPEIAYERRYDTQAGRF